MGAESLDAAALTQQLVALLNGDKGTGGQTRLAAKLRVTQECVSLWASGKRRPPWSAVVMMQRLIETHENAKESC